MGVEGGGGGGGGGAHNSHASPDCTSTHDILSLHPGRWTMQGVAHLWGMAATPSAVSGRNSCQTPKLLRDAQCSAWGSQLLNSPTRATACRSRTLCLEPQFWTLLSRMAVLASRACVMSSQERMAPHGVGPQPW